MYTRTLSECHSLIFLPGTLCSHNIRFVSVTGNTGRTTEHHHQMFQAISSVSLRTCYLTSFFKTTEANTPPFLTPTDNLFPSQIAPM